jgi:ATP/maltotriose-dependent transcriptional regulator MalT
LSITLRKALAIAERIGEVLLRANSLWALTATALVSHDVEAVRSLAPQVMAAGKTAADLGMVGTAKAYLAWLAWQDGRPKDVVALANEALKLWGTTVFAPYWLCLWPLIAVHLGAGQVAEAVAAGRQMLEPSQSRPTDELESLLGSACAAWDQEEPEVARAKMAEALELAKDLHCL